MSMYNIVKYKKLMKKYGQYASWAIWDFSDENTLLIDQSFNQLHSKFVFIGLNISRSLTNIPWSNFHGGRHDRKLKYACNDNELRGSYITDIFKDIKESKSNKLNKILTDEIIDKNVSFFNKEMRDIGINSKTKFIVLGMPNSLLSKYFNNYFKQKYKNEIIYHYHYSYYRLTDEKWVTGLWKKLGIRKNFNMIVKKYNK